MESHSLSEADRFLLDAVRRGESEAWSQLVNRFRGRLLAFARQRCRNSADAEDMVQDTFVRFVVALPSFRGESGLETYLFTILRRRIIDGLRLRRLNACQLSAAMECDDEPALATDQTASWYARRTEERQAAAELLAQGLRQLVEGYKQALKFQDLQLAEAIFYANLRNQQAAELTGMTEGQVGLKKHRWLSQLHKKVCGKLEEHPDSSPAAAENLRGLLHEIWESQRLSCPKRSTLGRYVLGTLDPGWQEYVRFHSETLGCGFCRANIQDMRDESRRDPAPALHQRILQSTVGFLRHV
jgi:RNA polymerase sigma factor (sigma-70 family)